MEHFKHEHWYTVGFHDGRHNINVFEHQQFSDRKPQYKAGLEKGKLQRKEDELIKLLKGKY